MQTQRTSNGRDSSRRSSRSSRSSGETDNTSIFELLIADHRAVAGVFEELKQRLEEDEPDEEASRDLLMKIDALLTPHARAEEELVYPAFAAAGDKAEDLIAESFEEHALVHQLLGQLKELSEVDKVWIAKAKVLMDLVEHHVIEEEDEVIPAARQAIEGDEAIALAAEFLSGKERFANELGLPAPETLDLPPPARSKPAKP